MDRGEVMGLHYLALCILLAAHEKSKLKRVSNKVQIQAHFAVSLA